MITQSRIYLFFSYVVKELYAEIQVDLYGAIMTVTCERPLILSISVKLLPPK